MLYRKTLIINEFYHLMQKPNGKSEVNHYKSIICLIVYPIVSKNTFSQHPSQLSPTIFSSFTSCHFLPLSSMPSSPSFLPLSSLLLIFCSSPLLFPSPPFRHLQRINTFATPLSITDFTFFPPLPSSALPIASFLLILQHLLFHYHSQPLSFPLLFSSLFPTQPLAQPHHTTPFHISSSSQHHHSIPP